MTADEIEEIEVLPFKEWYGEVLNLIGVVSPEYQGKQALCVGYNDSVERLIVWPLHNAKEILVEPRKCTLTQRVTVNDCIRSKGEYQPIRRPRSPGLFFIPEMFCGICVSNEIRAPVSLPCCNQKFCTPCISKRFNHTNTAETNVDSLRCPNCNCKVGNMMKHMLSSAKKIIMMMHELTCCKDDDCVSSGRHDSGACLLTNEVALRMKDALEKSEQERTIIPILFMLKDISKILIGAAGPGPSASPVKAHRALFRKMECKTLPLIHKLRDEHDGWIQMKATCGEIDIKLETLYKEIYGRPLLSPEEERLQRRQANGNDSRLNNCTQNDETYTREVVRMVTRDVDSTWAYIRSFGKHYKRVLDAFVNLTGQMATHDAKFCRTYMSEELAVNIWAMRRLDAMERLFEEGQYGEEEATEAFFLIKLLYNVCLVASGGDPHYKHSFIRWYGQDYILREFEGAIDPNFGKFLTDSIYPSMQEDSRTFVDEYDRPLLLLRPCAQYKDDSCAGGSQNPMCRQKEESPHDFIRCECKRVVYCSPACKELHLHAHGETCKEIIKARKAFKK